MNKSIVFWGPILFVVVLAGIGLMSRGQGWAWDGWLTAAAIIVPILGGAVWAFLRLKNDSEGATEKGQM